MPLIGGFYFDSYTTFLMSNLFKGQGGNPGENFVGFLEDLKTPKRHFEINWPLEEAGNIYTKKKKVMLPGSRCRGRAKFQVYAVRFLQGLC